MEDTHWVIDITDMGANDAVLILVLMEDTHWERFRKRSGMTKKES